MIKYANNFDESKNRYEYKHAKYLIKKLSEAVIEKNNIE